MANRVRINFGDRALPYLTLRLSHQEHSIAVNEMLDTGATVNVLSYNLGEQLGLRWEQQTAVLELAGNLRYVEARGVLLSAAIDGFPNVYLAFAWAQSSEVLVILGHINFFREFEVCFYSAQSYFDLRSKKRLP